MKTIKKKQKHKGRGTVRTITKQVPNESFFNFFNPLKGECGRCRPAAQPVPRSPAWQEGGGHACTALVPVCQSTGPGGWGWAVHRREIAFPV